jgi:hypothetical protein
MSDRNQPKLIGCPGQGSGEIEFDATGYIQELSRPAVVVSRQSLTWRERQE